MPSATVVDPTELVERESFRETFRGLEGYLGGVNLVELDSDYGTISILAIVRGEMRLRISSSSIEIF